MSGGTLETSPCVLRSLAEELENFVNKQWAFRLKDYIPNPDNGEHDHQFQLKTLDKISEAAKAIYKAAQMAERVDYLLSGDESENTFHLRWEEDNL